MKRISNKVRRWGVVAAILLFSCTLLSGQNYSISTNAAEWLALGTINAYGSAPVSRHVSLRGGAAYNPFTFGSGENQKYFRHLEFSFGARYWPWFVNSGWYLSAYADWAKYAWGGIFTSKAYEGYAYGAKLGGGYALMLDKGINLEMGTGIFMGINNYTRYSCPKCGRKEEKKDKFILAPAGILLGISFVF